jgi:hypothetical protein
MRRTIILGLMILLLLALKSYAGEANLAWDTVPEVDGYRVYIGPASGQYDRTEETTETTAQVLDLGDCTDYYFSVKAFRGTDESAEFSNEVTGWAQPGGTNSISMESGATGTFNLTGWNFKQGSRLDVAGESFFVTVEACNAGLVTLTGLPRGSYPMELVHPDGIYGEIGTLEVAGPAVPAVTNVRMRRK